MKLGDRIKEYEKTFYHSALKRMPLMIRVDGRAFHTFTRNMEKPFDPYFMKAMVESALAVAQEMQGFKAAYVQSDEVTFCLTDYDNTGTQGWFGYELPKVISISAALMSVHFSKYFHYTKKALVFDSRAFSIPKEDVVNAFLWRAQDWQRNSLQMYCRSIFSHKELFKKSRNEMVAMLARKGKDWWEDPTPQESNGTFIMKEDSGLAYRWDILPTYESIDRAIGHMFIAQTMGSK